MGVEEDKELHLYIARSTGLWISSEEKNSDVLI